MSIVRPDQAPPLLTSLERRQELLAGAGVDVVVVSFTADVASWSPARFVDEVIRPLRRPNRGRRELDSDFVLREMSPRWRSSAPVTVRRPCHCLPTAPSRVRRPSSVTRWPKAISDARERPDSRLPVLRRGGARDKRGREMGFPNANVPVQRGMAVPADGVYAGWVTRLDVPTAARWPAAISVGTNPTFDGVERRVEAYVLDRDDLELYDVPIAIDFYARLRGQVKYEGMER